HILAARATDSLGTSAISSNVTITVAGPSPTLGNDFWDPQISAQVTFRYAAIRAMAVNSQGVLYASGSDLGDSSVDPAFFTDPDFNPEYRIVKWDGGTWSGVFPPPGPDLLYPAFNALRFSGDTLYAGGLYDDGSGHVGLVVKWDGTNWTD